MIVKLRFLRQVEKLQELLQLDGWELERLENDSFLAKHPLVSSERTARIRLCYLGLLTSSALVIEFMFGSGERRENRSAIVSADS
jgi:hypothetical protein